jgi:hypothetical protein
MQDNISSINLDDIGLDLQENNTSIILKRNKNGNRIDFLAFLFGIISFPVLIYAVANLFYKIYNNDLHLGNIFSDVVFFSLGGYLFSLFLNGWNRKQMFGRFQLEKDHSEIKVRQRINFKIIEKTFSSNAQLLLSSNNKDAFVSLVENGNEHELFELKELNADQQSRIEKLIAAFNS